MCDRLNSQLLAEATLCMDEDLAILAETVKLKRPADEDIIPRYIHIYPVVSMETMLAEFL